MASVQVNISTPVETYLWLQKAAEEVDLTVPAFVRFIVEDYRKGLEPKKQPLPRHTYQTEEELRAIIDAYDESVKQREAEKGTT